MSEPSKSGATRGDWFADDGERRTDINCTECSKNFYALVDYRLSGNWEIKCAHCGHIHQRVVRDGKITEDRWGSTVGTDPPDPWKPRRVWKSSIVPVVTSSASEIMRQRWLERS